MVQWQQKGKGYMVRWQGEEGEGEGLFTETLMMKTNARNAGVFHLETCLQRQQALLIRSQARSRSSILLEGNDFPLQGL